MMRGTIEAAGGSAQIGEVSAAVPRVGRAEDIGSALLFLVGTPSGNWITGTEVVVDGGRLVMGALSRM